MTIHSKSSRRYSNNKNGLSNILLLVCNGKLHNQTNQIGTNKNTDMEAAVAEHLPEGA